MAADNMERCWPVTPDDLTASDRIEAETLATDLVATGGLGWFVICLTGRWNDLTERDRLRAAWCWELAVVPSGIAVAA